jgi:hypothetical protein
LVVIHIEPLRGSVQIVFCVMSTIFIGGYSY